MTPSLPAAVRPVLIGAATGLRSQWGMAALSLSSPPSADSSPVRRIVSGPWVRRMVMTAAAGEFIADKSPGVPGRLSWPGLVPRLVLGAVAGALVARRYPGEPTAVAASRGSAAAFVGAGAGVLWRRLGGPLLHADGLAAVLEDAVAAALAWAAVGNGPPSTGGGKSGPAAQTHR
ncbi:hypothetical protein OIB37_03495 [Streptomyces sp. NBC_00820]|uniref:hypothetical protein n=1 Tax=Streptomyces sp. NBC_00820 TaxID=2975842 RepID=UPI002ED28B5F|nr:hypothetical protein OIB37_03495 [Streptomyces sp. NBC_00820]